MLRTATNLIQFASDLHLEKGFKNRFIHPRKPVLILAGDIGNPFHNHFKEFLVNTSYYFDKVIVISGNHEYSDLHTSKYKNVDDRIRTVCSIKPNLLYLQKETHKLTEDITIAGCTLWSPKPLSRHGFHVDHVNWLSDLLRKKKTSNFVVATHHCPLYDCILQKYSPRSLHHFASNQDDLLKRNNNVLMWIYGHSHNNKSFFKYNKWIASNQFGSYEDPLFNYEN